MSGTEIVMLALAAGLGCWLAGIMRGMARKAAERRELAARLERTRSLAKGRENQRSYHQSKPAMDFNAPRRQASSDGGGDTGWAGAAWGGDPGSGDGGGGDGGGCGGD